MSNKTYSKLVKKLDRQLTTGRISRIEWRDARWKLLQVARPATQGKIDWFMSETNTKTLFGFPVVITDTVPKGEILFGRFPTWQELALYGSFEAAIQARKDQWAKIKGIPIEDK